MGERVDARDVLDPNARTVRPVATLVVGHFSPTGPNAWDDYQFVSRPAEPFLVRAGLEVQLEPAGAQFRVRSQGKVLRCRFQPSPEEVARAGGEAPSLLRQLLVADYLESFREAAGLGAASVIASKLRDDPE